MNLLIAYQNNYIYRQSFNQLAMDVFGLSFEDWYRAGYWNDNYIPYTLFNGTEAIANVSLSIIDFDVNGRTLNAVQIGTVMTKETHRNQQLNRLIMERVLKDWEDKVDLIYLYANSNVLNLYPKFGFRQAFEFMHSCQFDSHDHANINYYQLDMDTKKDRDLLYQAIKSSFPYAKIAMHKNNDLVMFYALSFLKNDIYYLPDDETILIASTDKETLTLWGIYGKKEIDIHSAIAKIASKSVKKVEFGFTPNNIASLHIKKIEASDTLFIRCKNNCILDTSQIMFPLLSHA